MKLNELTPKPHAAKALSGIKTSDRAWDWSRIADSYASDLGFKKIGVGNFGTIYKNDVYPYVIKIFNAKDINYISWLQWSIKNQSNRFVPKIKGSLSKVNDSLFAIRLEPLTECKDTKQVLALEVLINHPSSVDNLTDPYYQIGIKRLSENPKEDLDLKTVCEFLHKKQHQLDLGIDNFMMRGDQIVIVDPLYTPGLFGKWGL